MDLTLETLQGKMIGHCYPRHRHQEFSGDIPLHIIMDNYGTHKRDKAWAWLMHHPRFVSHFVPTSASWLNLVERWFGELSTEGVRRGAFGSVKDLKACTEGFLKA
ncbi:MAG: transposase [Nitrospirales bacterium]|nr:transposase [Nitrospirales bacterium]